MREQGESGSQLATSGARCGAGRLAARAVHLALQGHGGGQEVRPGDLRVVLAVRGEVQGRGQLSHVREQHEVQHGGGVLHEHGLRQHLDHPFHVGVQRQGLRLQRGSQGQEQHALRVLAGGAHHDRQDGDRDHRLGMVKKMQHAVPRFLHQTPKLRRKRPFSLSLRLVH